MRALLAVALTVSSGVAACGRKRDEAPARAAGDVPPPAAAPSSRAAGPPPGQVFSLVDNRLLAHVRQGNALLVIAGAPGFAKYLRFARPALDRLPFKLHQADGDVWVAVAEQYAPLDVPLDEAQAEARRVWVRIDPPAPRKLTLMVNGKAASTTQLEAGWQTASWAVPQGMLHAGENELLLASGKGEPANVAWIQVGGPKAADDDAPVLFDARRRALILPEGITLEWYLQVPPGGRLVGDVLGSCGVTVKARTSDAQFTRGALQGEGGKVELSVVGGKVVRLSLAAADGCGEARIAGAALVTDAPPAAAPPAKRRRPGHVVLWVMDSLRADRLEPFAKGARAETPRLDALAAKATLYTAAISQGNESRPAYASLMTSLYPADHELLRDGDRLADKWVTLGEAMKAAGFTTVGVTANGAITAAAGFADGFDVFKNHLREGGGTRGEDVVRDGLVVVDKWAKSPFFLFLSTGDAHAPWRAREPWITKYDPGRTRGRWDTEVPAHDVELWSAGKLKPSDRDQDRALALYDSNLSYDDELLGKLLDRLASWGIADDTMIVIVSDHGEELGEDGRVGHGASLRQAVVRVPLLVYWPPLFPAARVDEPVELVDVVPTILDALGMNPPEEAQGRSLLPLALGQRPGPAPGVASLRETAHVLRLGSWLLRVPQSGSAVLYDLAADPEERRDVGDTRPMERRMLTDALSTFLVYRREWRKVRWGTPANGSAQLADDLER